MKEKKYSDSGIAARLWLCTAFILSCGVTVYTGITDSDFPENMALIIPFFIASLIGSFPALLVLLYSLESIQTAAVSTRKKFSRLCILCLFICSLYGLLTGFLSQLFYSSINDAILFGVGAVAVLFIVCLIAIRITYDPLDIFFSAFSFEHQSNTTDMQQEHLSSETQSQSSFQHPASHWDPKPVNKTVIKAGITAALILLMLIPVSYIQALIEERQERQQQIVEEVSSKWAAAQTVTPLYLVIPYKTGDSLDKKPETENLVILPDAVTVKGDVEPQQRHRSTYDVLLYRSQLDMTGEFRFSLPKNITTDKLLLAEAKVCTGISDFKGIEKKVMVHIGNEDVLLSPGLPVNIDSNGLSAPVAITAEQLNSSLPFSLSLSLKGSSSLHFKPMSGNSSFELSSSWPHPSFEGNVIPVKDNGNEEASFPAKWSFSNANLPFSTVLQGDAIKNYKDLSFGVSLIQPVDQYTKSMRSIKYAILIIGLTFALFFIIEILQKNPVHPIQYTLVGLALVIFYSLLISISEFILFDYAYLIAATATVVLITLYTKSHFTNWKTAGIFFGILSGLYGFIYTLISLEDTALLTGSIALFVVLAIAMYATRKINWYQPLAPKQSVIPDNVPV